MSAICIEPLQHQHVETVRSLANNPLVSQTSGVPPNCDTHAVNEWIVQNKMGTKELTFTITADAHIVGCCALKNIDWQAKKAVLAYWLGVDFWGKGIATQASALLCDFAFKRLQLGTLESHFLKNSNKASGNVLKKLGFIADTAQADLPVADRYLMFAPDVWTFVVLPRTVWNGYRQHSTAMHQQHVAA